LKVLTSYWFILKAIKQAMISWRKGAGMEMSAAHIAARDTVILQKKNTFAETKFAKKGLAC